jgi:hypothetical protein
MSSSLLPQTMAQRPPFRGGPPVRTTFEGGFSGGHDPEYDVILESAARLLKTVDRTPVEEYPVLLQLLQQRYRWVEVTLVSMRILTSSSLPPIRGFDLDSYFETPDTLEGRFVRMLDSLNDAILKVQVKLKLESCPFPLSEL